VKKEVFEVKAAKGASAVLPLGSNDFLYAESKKARLERERVRKNKLLNVALWLKKYTKHFWVFHHKESCRMSHSIYI
jgi:selenophosphate synthetase-related protein